MITALNRDTPYDQFVVEQLTGDLLPNPTQEQIIVTGFLRNSVLNEEGAIIPEEFRMVEMFDRVDCIGKAVMGLTTGCAQCHNHKFDPLSQEEYYGLFAFFNDTHEAQSHVYTPADLQKLADIPGLWNSVPDPQTSVLHRAARSADERRPTHRLDRGVWNAPKELVEPHVPATLNPFPADASKNRLGFAKWLVDPRSPLTARVALNRIWQALFGQGLVETPDDFGARAPVPEYIDLLDWLAVDFMERGWSQKQAIRQIVMSETYRRSSRPNARSSPTAGSIPARWPQALLKNCPPCPRARRRRMRERGRSWPVCS